MFAAFDDPVVAGLVESLARPGGNVTGLTVQPNDLASNIDLLREIVPGMRRLFALANAAGGGFSADGGLFRAAAAMLECRGGNPGGSHCRRHCAGDGAGLKGRADALYVLSEPLANTNKGQIIAGGHREEQIPAIFGFREFVDAGGLISYGRQFFRTCSAVPPTLSTRSCAAQSLHRLASATTGEVRPHRQYESRPRCSVLEDMPQSFLLRADEVIE